MDLYNILRKCSTNLGKSKGGENFSWRHRMCLSEGKQESHSDHVTEWLGQGDMRSCFSSAFCSRLQVASTFWNALTVLYPLLIWNLSWVEWRGSDSSSELVICEHRKLPVQLQCMAWALLWSSVDRSNNSASSEHSHVSPFSWSFSSHILALDSWPLNVGKEKLALLCPHGFALQEAGMLTGYL